YISACILEEYFKPVDSIIWFLAALVKQESTYREQAVKQQYTEVYISGSNHCQYNCIEIDQLLYLSSITHCNVMTHSPTIYSFVLSPFGTTSRWVQKATNSQTMRQTLGDRGHHSICKAIC
ncbi:hypothetical protein LSH36_311g03036, partial [Paralvinella palmiformis]